MTLTLHDLRRTDQMDREALKDENRRLREALAAYLDDRTPGGVCDDMARAALAAEPASGAAIPQRHHDGRWIVSDTSAPPPPPTQGEEDTAIMAMKAQVYPRLWPGPLLGETADERQRVDEATRAENEACAQLAARNPFAHALDIAFAIRARVAPKGEP